LFFEFTVVDKSSYDLKDQLELVLVLSLRHLFLLCGCLRLRNLPFTALQEAGKDLAAPLLRAVSV